MTSNRLVLTGKESARTVARPVVNPLLQGCSFMGQGSPRNARFSSAGGQSSSNANVPLLDVNRSTAEMREELLAAVARAVDSGRFLHGPDVAEFEQAVAKV